MPRDKNRGRSSSRSDDWGMTELVRDRPIAAAAAAAGAAAAGLFLWSKRSQISQQLSNLSDQISDWTESMSSGNGSDVDDDTAGLTTTGQTGTRSSSGSASAPKSSGARTTRSRTRSRSATTS